MPSRFSLLGGAMAVLSAAPARTSRHRVSVFGAAVAHGLILAALANATRHPAAPAEPATIELIVTPAVAQPEPEPAPPDKTAAAAAPAGAPAAPEIAPEAPPSTADLPAPAPAGPTPEAQSVVEQAPSPEPSVQPTITPEVVTSVPSAMPRPAIVSDPVTPVTPVTPAPSTPRAAEPRPFRRFVMSRPASHKAATSPAARPPEPAAAVSRQAARPPANGGGQAVLHVEETLSGRIRDAVQAAVRCPAAARMMDQSGKAGVAFNYRDGALIGGVQLARSSGMPMLDTAALTAVRNAHYPEAPPEVSDQMLHLLIWVEEACGG